MPPHPPPPAEPPSPVIFCGRGLLGSAAEGQSRAALGCHQRSLSHVHTIGFVKMRLLWEFVTAQIQGRRCRASRQPVNVSELHGLRITSPFTPSGKGTGGCMRIRTLLQKLQFSSSYLPHLLCIPPQKTVKWYFLP